ncbi:MAG TPA: hypothetical protein VKX17_28220 [Planctomycetota bacterium]|nr:hypothetical protein [Planctomycetota bacterium]
MMKNIPLKRNLPMLKEAERKEREDNAAKRLSSNLNEAVEKSIAKKSKDEVQSKPS